MPELQKMRKRRCPLKDLFCLGILVFRTGILTINTNFFVSFSDEILSLEDIEEDGEIS
jgi:cytoskeletal protein RodZ